MIDISKLNKLELKDTLKKLKLLSSLRKSLWKRWNTEFERLNAWVNSYKVEYYDFGDSSLSFTKEKSLESFKKLFWIDISIEEIQFIKNQDIKWWFRIFFNDNMYDLSYQRFEWMLK